LRRLVATGLRITLVAALSHRLTGIGGAWVGGLRRAAEATLEHGEQSHLDADRVGDGEQKADSAEDAAGRGDEPRHDPEKADAEAEPGVAEGEAEDLTDLGRPGRAAPEDGGEEGRSHKGQAQAEDESEQVAQEGEPGEGLELPTRKRGALLQEPDGVEDQRGQQKHEHPHEVGSIESPADAEGQSERGHLGPPLTEVLERLSAPSIEEAADRQAEKQPHDQLQRGEDDAENSGNDAEHNAGDHCHQAHQDQPSESRERIGKGFA
jgi:hypothetical protein